MTEPVVAPLLEVRRVRKHFGELVALDDVSFTIPEGAVVGLIGPNGAGKTTLLECLAGLIPVDMGEVIAGGEPLPSTTRHRLLFLVPDGITPWEDQSVGWVLRFFEALHGGDTTRRERVTVELSLQPILGQSIGTLSRGQRKRFLVALGLITPHPLLLLDEPFDGLDVRQTREIAAVLRAYAAEGRTLFLSIHQLVDAVRVCDRMVLLSGGRLVGAGTLAELQARSGLDGGSLEEVFLALT